jgi:hypothetical protein
MVMSVDHHDGLAIGDEGKPFWVFGWQGLAWKSSEELIGDVVSPHVDRLAIQHITEIIVPIKSVTSFPVSRGYLLGSLVGLGYVDFVDPFPGEHTAIDEDGGPLAPRRDDALLNPAPVLIDNDHITVSVGVDPDQDVVRHRQEFRLSGTPLLWVPHTEDATCHKMIETCVSAESTACGTYVGLSRALINVDAQVPGRRGTSKSGVAVCKTVGSPEDPVTTNQR